MSGGSAGRVSVVIPVYNGAPWIGEALRSVLAQTRPAEEIIVADCGSTDETLDVVRSVAATSIVVSVEGRGPAVARNAGLERATGEFIQFLDADDLLHPEKLALDLAVLEQSGADVVWSEFDEIDATSRAGAWSIVRHRAPLVADDVPFDLIGAEGFIQIGAVLLRRSPATAGVRFERSMPVVEDVRFLMDLAHAGARFVRRDGPGLLWRQHDSATRASRVADSVFYRAVAANASHAHDTSVSRGEPITAARRARLLDTWLIATEQLARVGDAALESVVARMRALDPAYHRRARSPHRYLLPLLGARRTFVLTRDARRVLDRIMRGRGAPVDG